LRRGGLAEKGGVRGEEDPRRSIALVKSAGVEPAGTCGKDGACR